MKKNIFSLLILFLIISCSKEESDPKADKNDRSEILTKKFSKENMLIYWADYVIIPGYEDLAKTSTEMEENIQKFTTSPSSNSLLKARESWLKTYMVWQKVSVTEVGKAAIINLTWKLNSYPTNITTTKKYIEGGRYDLSLPKMTISEGFPALDYLLNTPDEIVTDDEIIKFYKENDKYKTYLNDVSKEINNLAILVRDDFKNVYRTKFIKKFKDNDISSVKKVTKYFTYKFIEYQLHNNKIAKPSGNGYPSSHPECVEAIYKKDVSKKLYLTALNAAINFYNGKSYDGKVTGHGLKQYLEFLNRKDLDEIISQNFDAIVKASDDLDNNFLDQINDIYGIDDFDKTSRELEKLLKLFKIDLLSAIGLDTNGGVDTDND